jgi:rhodanese-related sulfurtransferase
MKTLRIPFIFIYLLLAAAISSPLHAEDEFPLRAQFPKVAPIELDALFKQQDKVVIFDVRSGYEYETLHIKGAQHLPLDDREFVAKLKAMRKEEQRPFVFYCNGHTCKKSYKAAQKAMRGGIANVFTFDAGIFTWTKAHPDQAVLLGNSPVDPKSLISKKQLEAHMLKPEKFGLRVGNDTIVLDIRDIGQTSTINLFPMYQHSVPLDNKKLDTYVRQAKSSGKTLMIYDAVGKQVRWLQYYLEAARVPKYYFMKGGAQAFLDY